MCNILFLAFDAKMMDQWSILAFYFQVRGSVFPQRSVMNDDSNVLPGSKRTFSDVLEDMVLKNLYGVNVHLPPTSL